MKRLIGLIIIILFLYGCSTDDDVLDRYFVSEIVNFDLNCSTCNLKFPDDSKTIENEFGISRDGYYQTMNLQKDTLKIGQRLLVKLRAVKDNDYRACITLYPSYDYKPVYVVDFKFEK
jgi:hypothetical protein